MDTNKMRDDLLENAFSRLGDDKGQGLHPYFKDAFRRGWEEAWKLSREAVVVELPNRAAEAYCEEFDDVEGGSFNEVAYIRDVRKAIEAQGLKVKP